MNKSEIQKKLHKMDKSLEVLGSKGFRTRQAGFTIIELSIVLLIIAVLVSIATVGADVYRNAQGVRAYSDFVQGWVNAYQSYMTNSGGLLPGDDATAPLGQINGGSGGGTLCDTPSNASLSNAMLSRGVSLPSGRAEGQPSKLVYEDHNGLPHEIQICMQTVQWSVPGTSVGTYQLATKNVLLITGLTAELAMQMDSMIDNRVDARFGSFRESNHIADTGSTGAAWSIDATRVMVSSQGAEGQLSEVVAYLLLN